MKHTPYIMAALLLGLVVLVSACSSNPNNTTPTGQAIKLVSSDSGQYSPAQIKVKLGSTVRIEGDPQTLVGGMDTVVIDAYGIRKKISPTDNVIEFTANKAGTFDVVCANGMGNGKLIVEQ